MSDNIWNKVETVADYLGIPDATVRTWRSRGNVPPARHKELVKGAKKKAVSITYEELNSIQ